MHGISDCSTATGTTPITGIMDKKSRVAHIAAAVPMAISRQAFRALLALNIGGVATVLDAARRLNRKFNTSLGNAWYNIGGNWGDLKSAISSGVGKKPFGLKLLPNSIQALYASYVNATNRGTIAGTASIGEPVTAAITTAAAASTPVWVALIPVFTAALALGSKALELQIVKQGGNVNYADTSTLQEGGAYDTTDNESTSTAGFGILAALLIGGTLLYGSGIFGTSKKN
mgnify:CR=1 FL=1